MIAFSSLILLPFVFAVQVSPNPVPDQNHVTFFPTLGALVCPGIGGPSSGVVQQCWVQQWQSTEDAGRVWKGLQPHH
jgi:hypothetical protein